MESELLPGPSDDEIAKEIRRHISLCGPDFPDCGIGHAMRYIFAQEAARRAPSEREKAGPYQIVDGRSRLITDDYEGWRQVRDAKGNIVLDVVEPDEETDAFIELAVASLNAAPSASEREAAEIGRLAQIEAFEAAARAADNLEQHDARNWCMMQVRKLAALQHKEKP